MGAWNSIQRYMYPNCKPSSSYGCKKLKGFWIERKKKNWHIYFRYRTVNLVLTNECNAKQMILMDIVSEEFGNLI